MSLSPVLYSTPDGCAALGDKGFDAVWAAVPGNSDPSGIFAPTFFPGDVAVQYGETAYLGVDYDLSISEFSFIGGQPDPAPDPPSPLPEVPDMEVILAISGPRNPGDAPDPHNAGAVYLAEAFHAPQGWVVVRKRWVTDENVEAIYTAQGLTVQTVPAAVLDRAEDGPPVTFTGSGAFVREDQLALDALAALKAEVDALAAAAPQVDLSGVNAQLGALAKHLGLGQP